MGSIIQSVGTRRWTSQAPSNSRQKQCKRCRAPPLFLDGSNPRRDAEAQERFKKRGLRDILKATAAAHPDKRLQLWFQDEARVGNKGRVCHRWWRRGERAPGTRQIGYAVGLHLLRRAPGHRRRRHPRDAERQRQGHGPVSRTLRRYPGPGCARRHDVRRRRLARRARPHRPRQRHLGAVAALQSRTQPRRAGLALPTRTLP